jgi:hypothetical protein
MNGKSDAQDAAVGHPLLHASDGGLSTKRRMRMETEMSKKVMIGVYDNLAKAYPALGNTDHDELMVLDG